MRFLGLFVSLVAAEISILKKADLESKDTFLTFLYYEQEGFYCHACKHFANTLENLDIAVKKLNFADNIALGSKFLQFSFPAFIVRSEGKSYVIHPQASQELQDTIRTGAWREVQPVRPLCDVNSLIVRIVCVAMPCIFKALDWMYYAIDNIPSRWVSCAIIAIIIYLIYSIVDIFIEPDAKIKVD